MPRPAPRALTRVALLVLTSLALASSAPSTFAEPRTGTVDAAEVEFQLGNKAYVAGQYDRALSHYFESYRLSPNLNVLFNVAGCYEAQGAWVEAYRYYQEHALGADPSHPAVAQSKAALTRLEGRVALLSIASNAPEASIFLDRKDLGAYGTAPRLVPVKPSTYKVILESPGFDPWERDGVVAALGQTVVVEAKMARKLGELEVTGRPEGAEIVARIGDLTVTGTLPAVLSVGAGEVDVEVSAPGHVTRRATVTVPARARTRLDVTLLAQTGALIVSADEDGALVRLDGQPVGFTPTVIDDVLVGSHELAVEVPGYQTFRRTVTIDPDEREEVRAELSVGEEVEAASRFAETAERAPASVTLLSGLELQAFGVVHIADALRGVRGLYTTDDGLYVSSGFRGFSPFGDYNNRVLIQLDGKTLNEDWYGSSLIGFEGLAAVDMLDRIEIVRGPGSTLHGSGSIFGVLNLVTRDEITELGGQVKVAAVGPHTGRVTAEVGVPFEDGVALVWGGLVYEQPGDYFSSARADTEEFGDGVGHGLGETWSGSTHAKVRWRDLTFSGFFNRRDRQVPPAHYGSIFGDTRTRVVDTRSFAELRYEPRLADDLLLVTRLEWDLSAYAADYAYTEEDGGVLSEQFDGQSIGLEARLIWEAATWARVTGGASYRNHFENVARGFSESEPTAPFLDETHPFERLSLFATADLEAGPMLTVSAGARFDGIFVDELPDPEGNTADESFLTFNPRLALNLRPSDANTLKLMLGRAFRAPSVGELTYNDGGFTQIPSPSVRPETAYTAELELTQRLGAGFDLVVGGFLTSIDDLIQLSGEGDEANPFQYVNQGATVWSTGAEIELRRQFQRGQMLSVSYSGQHTRVGSIGGDGVLPNSPVHIFGARSVLPILGRALSFTSRLAIESGRRDRDGGHLGASVLLDVGLWGQRLDGGFEYGVWVRNVLDWRIENPVGEEVEDLTVRQPGRHITATIGYRF